MTDDELTKEAERIVHGSFLVHLDLTGGTRRKCIKQEQFLKLKELIVDALRSVAKKARAAGRSEGYEEAKEQAAKLCEQEGLWKQVLPREIRSMKPEGKENNDGLMGKVAPL